MQFVVDGVNGKNLARDDLASKDHSPLEIDLFFVIENSLNLYLQYCNKGIGISKQYESSRVPVSAECGNES